MQIISMEYMIRKTPFTFPAGFLPFQRGQKSRTINPDQAVFCFFSFGCVVTRGTEIGHGDTTTPPIPHSPPPTKVIWVKNNCQHISIRSCCVERWDASSGRAHQQSDVRSTLPHVVRLHGSRIAGNSALKSHTTVRPNSDRKHVQSLSLNWDEGGNSPSQVALK